MKRNQWLKFFIIWILYVLLHFTYKIIPCNLTFLFGCPEETIFHHMKMAFLSFSLISIGEYILLRPREISGFIPARMISAILFSYFTFIIWLIYPVIFGPISSVAGEIIYSNIILAACLLVTIYLETYLETLSFNKAIFSLISFFYLIILAVFVISTFHTPHIDVFSPHTHH
jgi:hypothetical protein